jgi:hypothetical protein
MDEDQERDSSSDEEGQIIEDEDMEDSPTDTPEFWMSDRNDGDTQFVRSKGDTNPTKKHHYINKILYVYDIYIMEVSRLLRTMWTMSRSLR